MAAVSGEYQPKMEGLHDHSRGRYTANAILSMESTQRSLFVGRSLCDTLEEFQEYYESFMRDFTRMWPSEKPKWTRCVANLEETKKRFEAGDETYKDFYRWHLYENWDLTPYNH